MRRAAVAVTASAFVIVALLASPAAAQSPAQQPRTIFVLWVDHTTLADWSAPDLSAFARLLSRASVATLSTRTLEESSSPARMRAAAAYTFADGARRSAAGSPSCPLACVLQQGGRVSSWGVGAAYARIAGPSGRGAPPSGSGPVAPPPGTPVAPGGAVPFRDVPPLRDPSSPGGERADARTIAARIVVASRARVPFVLVDPEDGARVEDAYGSRPRARAPWLRRAMRDADTILAAMLSSAQPQDLVMVVSPTPPVPRRRDGIRLGAIAMAGPGFPAGLLRSATTRRAGVVALVDAAPTLVPLLDPGSRRAMEGRPMRSVRAGGAVAKARALEREIVHAARARRPLTRAWLLFATLCAILSLLTVVAGRGRARRGALPVTWRDWLVVLLILAAAAPTAMYAEGALPTGSVRGALLAVGLLSLAIALLARAVLGATRALGLVLLASAAVPIVDLLAGEPLAHRSAIAYQIAGGGRFYGVDEAVLGMIVGGGVFGAALLLDRARDLRRLTPALALGLGLAVLVMSAPGLGAKFGAAPTAVPAFSILALRIGGRRLDFRAGLAIVAATVAVTGLFVLADTVRGDDARSHVARATQDDTGAGTIVARKIAATARITASTAWTPAALALAGAPALLAWRRRQTTDRAMWGRPFLRAAFTAGLVGGACAVLFNDGGIVAAAPIAVAAAGCFFVAVLAGDS